MGFKYETQGAITYLVYTIQPEDKIDTMGLGMLTNNKIPGLAATQFTQMDTERYIKFNVSARIPVSQFFSGAVNKKRLVGVFKGIVSALISAEEYMIDPNSILLDLEYIFTDVSTCDTILICLPIEREHTPVNQGQFFKNIMFSTQFDQTENCDYVAKIMNYLNSAPVFSADNFAALMDQLQKEGASAPPTPSVNRKPVVNAQPAASQPQTGNASMTSGNNQANVNQQTIQPAPETLHSRKIEQQTIPGPNYQQQPVYQQPINIQQQQVQRPQQPHLQQQPPAATGKKMTALNLMMHYNKENLAAYKAQKEAEKAAKNGGAAPAAIPQAAPAAQPAKKAKKEKKKKDNPSTGFAVPGQQPGFAVPGQQPGFAVPGQQPGFAVPGQQPNFAAPGQQPVRQPNFGAAAQQPAAKTRPAPIPQPAAQQQSYRPQPVPQPVQPQQTIPQQRVSNPPQQTAPVQSQPMNFGETTVLGGGSFGETTVLGAAVQDQALKPHLIRAKNNERIAIDKPVFRIGKERSYVDYFVADNPAISRSHANIIARDGVYFIMDTNSTNHTYVNGGMIQSNSEVKISHGSKIRLANEEFEFRLY